jgi:hypothetical protein
VQQIPSVGPKLKRQPNYQTTFQYQPFAPTAHRREQFAYYQNYLVDDKRVKWPEANIRMSPEDVAYRVSLHYKPSQNPEVCLCPTGKPNITIPTMMLPVNHPFIIDTSMAENDSYILRVIPIGDIASNTTIF